MQNIAILTFRHPSEKVNMNTARSVWMGWATLMVAGAGAYYFAKKDINAHRREQELKGLRSTEFLDCKFPSLETIFVPYCPQPCNLGRARQSGNFASEQSILHIRDKY